MTREHFPHGRSVRVEFVKNLANLDAPTAEEIANGEPLTLYCNPNAKVEPLKPVTYRFTVMSSPTKAMIVDELGLMHRDGIPWWDAPLPRRWHRCFAQSERHGIRRCACGGISYDGGRWLCKNERRRTAR